MPKEAFFTPWAVVNVAERKRIEIIKSNFVFIFYKF